MQGGPFSSQIGDSLGKLKLHQNYVFHKRWVQKGSLLTMKITSDWKTISSGNIYGILSLPYMFYLSSNPHGSAPFFKPMMCLFGKIEILSKSWFLVNHGLIKAPVWLRKSLQTENLFHQGVSMESMLHHTCVTLSCNPHSRKSFFKPMMCFFGKI